MLSAKKEIIIKVKSRETRGFLELNYRKYLLLWLYFSYGVFCIYMFLYSTIIANLFQHSTKLTRYDDYYLI